MKKHWLVALIALPSVLIDNFFTMLRNVFNDERDVLQNGDPDDDPDDQ